MIKLLIAILFLAHLSSPMQKQKFVTNYLLPHTTNTASPFSLHSIAPHASTITLRITCSKQALQLPITTLSKNLCTLKETKGDFSEIEKILKNVKIKINAFRKFKKKLTINYDLIFFNELSKKPKMKSIQQKLLLMEAIPIKIKKQRIEKKSETDVSFKVPVAEISRKYLVNAEKGDIDVEYDSSLPSDFLTHSFVNNTVYIQGSFPENYSIGPTGFFHFDLNLIDKRTELRSQKIKMHVLDSNEKPRDPSHVFMVFFLFLAVLIFFNGQVLFLVNDKFLVIDEIKEAEIEEKLKKRRIKRVKSSPNLGVVWDSDFDCEKGQLGEELEILKEEFKRLPELCKKKWKSELYCLKLEISPSTQMRLNDSSINALACCANSLTVSVSDAAPWCNSMQKQVD